MRGVLFHGLLALLGLVFAYQTWTRKPEQDVVPGEVTALPCTLASLQQINLDTPTHSIVVEPEREQSGDRYWITVRRKSEAEITGKPVEQVSKPDAGKPFDATSPVTAKDKPAKPAAVDPLVPKRFLANAEFDAYLKRLAPLRAARALGALPKDKLADFGFNDVGTHLNVSCGGQKLTLDVGTNTFGAAERYARDAKTKLAYLFDAELITDLQAAQFKFMQTELHGFPLSEVDEAKVEARGATRRLIHRDRALKQQAQWVDASQPARRNELYGNWFDRLSKLRIKDFLPPGAEPGSDLQGAAEGSTPVVTVDYMQGGKPKGKLELVRVDAAGAAHYYARTETSRGWTSLYDSGAKDVDQDAAMVVGLQEAAPAKPAAPAAH